MLLFPICSPLSSLCLFRFQLYRREGVNEFGQGMFFSPSTNKGIIAVPFIFMVKD